MTRKRYVTPINPIPPRRPCASCDVEIEADLEACPACGNNPAREAVIALLASALFAAVLYAIIPVAGLLFLPVVLLVGIAVFVLDHSPTETSAVI